MSPVVPAITLLYGGLLALLYLQLSRLVIGARREAKVALGDQGHPLMLRRMRVHANFAEYVPLTLVLLALVEIAGLWSGLCHLIGLLLLAGRLLHAYGVGREPEDFRYRVRGMGLTFAALATVACSALALAVMFR